MNALPEEVARLLAELKDAIEAEYPRTHRLDYSLYYLKQLGIELSRTVR